MACFKCCKGKRPPRDEPSPSETQPLVVNSKQDEPRRSKVSFNHDQDDTKLITLEQAPVIATSEDDKDSAKLRTLEQALEQAGVGLSKTDIATLANSINFDCLGALFDIAKENSMSTDCSDEANRDSLVSSGPSGSQPTSGRASSFHNLMPPEFYDMIARMQDAGLDTTLYGKENQKSLEELWYDTCIVRDCELVTLEDGSLQRIVTVVKIRVLAIDEHKTHRCLYSMGKVLGSGRTSRLVDKQDLLSRKTHDSETTQDTVRLALEERLGISSGMVQTHFRLAYDNERYREEKALSPGYPGLQGLYKFHEVDAMIVDASHPDLKCIGLPEAKEFIVKDDAAGDGEFEFLTTQRMWAWLDAPDDLTPNQDFKPLRPLRQRSGLTSPRKSKKKKTFEAIDGPITVDWEVETNAGWLAWAPGVDFCGKAGEEVTYTRGEVTYRATFHDTCSGTQTNLSTGTSRKLRVVPKVIDLDEASRLKDAQDEEPAEEADFGATLTAMSLAEPTSSLNADNIPHGAIIGAWKCVATSGLEAFLKASGANIFQRKIALGARWPSWEFKAGADPTALLRFINNTAMGVLKEEMSIGGIEYHNKDGHGNDMRCKTVWEPTETGGNLRTTRTGTMGSYTEDRRVDKDSLEFVLTSEKGSWGRTFTRA